MKNTKAIPFLLNHKKNLFLLVQFFLIIFAYHTLKDLKDTVVITASSAGAEIIPFIKIWGMLPIAVGASFLFSKIYNRFHREKTLYFFISLLLFFYVTFAFVLYPLRDHLYLNNLDYYLTMILPAGCRGLVAMICYWHYTLFYLTAELWSLLILSILFWGYVNETNTLTEAKKFYPICMFTGNFAGILSGQTSYYLSHHLREYLSWQETLQLMIALIAICGLVIMAINRWLLKQNQTMVYKKNKTSEAPSSFKGNVLAVMKSGPLLCIAVLVIGFGLTSNLIEVVWKESIRVLYPSPQAYNAYINQITSLIGISAVVMAFLSQWIFAYFSWRNVALITPVTLFITSFTFFSFAMMPLDYLSTFSSYLNVSSLVLIVTLGSAHYVLGMTAKYTIFDACKEMAFLSINTGDRMKAKSVIDSMGSRLGKTGASCLYQFLLVAFGSTSGHLSVIGVTSMLVIGVSILATRRLGSYMKDEVEVVHLETAPSIR